MHGSKDGSCGGLMERHKDNGTNGGKGSVSAKKAAAASNALFILLKEV